MLRLEYARFRVPGGAIVVVADPTEHGDRPGQVYGAVTLASFGTIGAIREQYRGVATFTQSELPEIADVIERYNAGDLDALEEVSVAQQGGDFYRRGWAAMRKVRAGTVATYAELAKAAGSPAAWRAAGSVCSTNTVPLFVPCHRIVAAHGRLGGYAYGPEVKIALLEHEGVML